MRLVASVIDLLLADCSAALKQSGEISDDGALQFSDTAAILEANGVDPAAANASSQRNLQ